MVGVDTEVFVHVKGDHALPVDAFVGDEPRQKLVLAGRGGEDDVGLPCFALPGGDRLGHGRGGGMSGQSTRFIDEDFQCLDGEASDCRDFRDGSCPERSRPMELHVNANCSRVDTCTERHRG